MIPELTKLIDLSDLFACKLDSLVREALTVHEDIYSEVTIKTVKAFRMGRYVMVTPNPEDDVFAYLDAWAQRSGLLNIKPDAKKSDGIFHMFLWNYRTVLVCGGIILF